jgi:hypothetical protein
MYQETLFIFLWAPVCIEPTGERFFYKSHVPNFVTPPVHFYATIEKCSCRTPPRRWEVGRSKKRPLPYHSLSKILESSFSSTFLVAVGFFCAKKKIVFSSFCTSGRCRGPAGRCLVPAGLIESHRVDPKNPKKPEKTRKNPKKPEKTGYANDKSFG